MRPPQYTHLADKIEIQLREDQEYVLKSIGDLARKWHTSYPTMHKAVHLLAKRGVVQVGAGKRIQRALAGNQKLAHPASSFLFRCFVT